MAGNSPLSLGSNLGKSVAGFSNQFNFDWNSAKDAGKTTLQGGVQAFAKELSSQENLLGGAGSFTGNAIAGIQGAFKEQVKQLEAVQSEATVAMQDYATGGEIPLHQVMMRVNRAELSLQLATQVRNKILSAYQEISHMQI